MNGLYRILKQRRLPIGSFKVDLNPGSAPDKAVVWCGGGRMDGSLTEGKRPSGPSREEVQRDGLVPAKCPEVKGPAVSVAVR